MHFQIEWWNHNAKETKRDQLVIERGGIVFSVWSNATESYEPAVEILLDPGGEDDPHNTLVAVWAHALEGEHDPVVTVYGDQHPPSFEDAQREIDDVQQGA